VKDQAGYKEKGKIADCGLQIADSRIGTIERQTGNSTVTKNGWLWLLLFLVGGALLTIAAFHFDASVQIWIGQHQTHSTRALMRNISRFGDWPEHLAVGLLLAGIAWVRGNNKWTRVFLAMVIAMAMAGLVGRVIKISTGRARPSVKSEEIWNGPRLSSKFHAFPSGHTAASTAFVATLFFASWRIGLACLPIPVLIGFSRMYVAAHYLSDVTCAILLGIICAFLSARLLFLGWKAEDQAAAQGH
jgi:membrane-associated phospholipid phosphatase